MPISTAGAERRLQRGRLNRSSGSCRGSCLGAKGLNFRMGRRKRVWLWLVQHWGFAGLCFLSGKERTHLLEIVGSVVDAGASERT